MRDPKSTRELLETIKSLKGSKTIIYITHHLDEALLADRVMVMSKGEILSEGTVEEVFDNEAIINEAKLEIFDGLKLLKMIENEPLKNKKEVMDILWQLTYKK